MNHSPRQRVAAFVGAAAVASAIGVTGLIEPTSDATAHPSAGTEVTVVPTLKPPTVTQTTAPSAPATPFATPAVRAPQAGAE
jgi:hypothetical protein